MVGRASKVRCERRQIRGCPSVEGLETVSRHIALGGSGVSDEL